MRGPHDLAILYVGDRARGDCLRTALQQRGWEVYVPTEMLEALGLYVFYSPDVVLIDAGGEVPWGWSVYQHLHSIQADVLLVIADECQHRLWQDVAYTTPYVLPLTANPSDAVTAMIGFIERYVGVGMTEGGRATPDRAVARGNLPASCSSETDQEAAPATWLQQSGCLHKPS